MVNNTPQVKYIIDTSSILSQKDNEPHRRTINKTLWKHIDELISQKRIVTCSEINEEVNDDALKKWFVGLQGDILPISERSNSLYWFDALAHNRRISQIVLSVRPSWWL